ncbi:unnamed protein product [Gemmata massiliana]|uniref:Uncharacterized protein n=1 Tax=Gemmata massiliana TaxID=1210884 RepID=A0A6P2DFC5_9BACT|nr:hypothetical protein [Gemmata massiliana]VTS00399.1 unnamed protein product [Gemmata massiliana]
MGPKPNESAGMGVRERATLVANLLLIVSRPWRLACTRTGADGPGWREISNINALWGLGALFLFAALGRSDVLWVALMVAVLSEIEHRVRACRDVHSRFMGVSGFTRLVKNPLRARQLESFVAMAIGALLADVDRAAGWWFILAGLGNLVTVGLASARERHVDQDVLDAQWEATGRAGRLEDRYSP